MHVNFNKKIRLNKKHFEIIITYYYVVTFKHLLLFLYGRTYLYNYLYNILSKVLCYKRFKMIMVNKC